MTYTVHRQRQRQSDRAIILIRRESARLGRAGEESRCQGRERGSRTAHPCPIPIPLTCTSARRV